MLTTYHYMCLFTAVIYTYQTQCLSCDILQNVGATHTVVSVLLHVPVLYNKQVGPKNLLGERLHYLYSYLYCTLTEILNGRIDDNQN
jgi:hypothetical protein